MVVLDPLERAVVRQLVSTRPPMTMTNPDDPDRAPFSVDREQQQEAVDDQLSNLVGYVGILLS